MGRQRMGRAAVVVLVIAVALVLAVVGVAMATGFSDGYGWEAGGLAGIPDGGI